MENDFDRDGTQSSFCVASREAKDDGSPAVGAAGFLDFSADGVVGVTIGFTGSFTLHSPASRETIEAAVLAWAHALVHDTPGALVAHIVRVEQEDCSPTSAAVH